MKFTVVMETALKFHTKGRCSWYGHTSIWWACLAAHRTPAVLYRDFSRRSALYPDYVLMADNVVYVISGKSSEQLIPLAEVTRLRFQKNEMLMVLRPEWDRSQMIEEAEASAAVSRHMDGANIKDH